MGRAFFTIIVDSRLAPDEVSLDPSSYLAQYTFGHVIP
jgi:hypothetical protein